MSLPPDKLDRITAQEPITPGRPGAAPQPGAAGTGFESHMQSASTPPGASPTQGPASATAPQVPQLQTAGPSHDSILAQMSTSQDSLSTLKNKMDTKDLRLTRSQQHLLRNKLNDASTHLRAVNSKLGVETPPMKPKAGARPIERFMNFIGDGEDQLAAARTKIEALSKSGDQLSPADFLVIQIKMNQAQQEIDYASTLLSKVISSLTQVLNTQL